MKVTYVQIEVRLSTEKVFWDLILHCHCERAKGERSNPFQRRGDCFVGPYGLLAM